MTTNNNAAPIIMKLKYWRDYDGQGDEYRRTHDLDCLLTGGDLRADTIFSLWLPLRYAMNHFDKPRWQDWRKREFEKLKPRGIRLKDHTEFLNDMIEDIDAFLDLNSSLAKKLSTLFDLGQQRCNVILLPEGKREWNTLRGSGKYFDFFPHFLADLFCFAVNEDALRQWLREESLEPFFANETFGRENILDLIGTGSPCRHAPKDIDLDRLLTNYIAILRRRSELLELRAV